MKKALVVLLILAVAGGVFAQEITWSGEVATGLYIDMADANDDVMIKMDDDDVPTGVKARLQAQVTGDNWGIELGFGADIDDKDFGVVAGFYNAHGWLDFMDGMIRVRSGLIDPGVWTTKGPEDFNLSSGLGVRLEVMPIDGLNVGVALNFDNDEEGAIMGTGRDGDGNAAVKFADFFQEAAFGFSYSMPDMMGLYISAAFKLDSKFLEGGLEDDKARASTLIFGIGLKPMDPLTVAIEGKIANLGDYSNVGYMWFIEDISYQVMDALKAGIRMDQKIASEDSAAANEMLKTWLQFKPYAEYAVSDALLVGLDIPIAMGDVDGIKMLSFGGNIWGKYSVSDNASVKIGYGFTSFTKDGSSTGESYLDHYIRLLFNYSF